MVWYSVMDGAIRHFASVVEKIPGWPMPQQKYQGPKIELPLYQHEESANALRLSRDGCLRNSKWIPRSLLSSPMTLQLRKVDGEACEFGIFYVADFKAKEVGWLVEEDKRQLRLV